MVKADTVPADQLCHMAIPAIAQLMAKKRLSPVELLAAFLDRCDRLNGYVNAIVAIDKAAAREQALLAEGRFQSGLQKGLLDGIPITIKDNIFATGFGATWGSRLFASFRPAEDDIPVERLRGAGAIILGKTNTPELALASHTDNLVFGKTLNPWDLSLTPGGSSGGAAAAVCSGMAPLAIGTDAGGSMRRPAGYTGIVGMRPSTGCIPRAAGFPRLAYDFQVIAPAARTIDDLFILLSVIAGPDRRDHASLAFQKDAFPSHLKPMGAKSLRIRYLRRLGNEPMDEEILRSMDVASENLAALGHDVIEGAAPYDLAEVNHTWSVLSSAGAARAVVSHADWKRKVGAAVAEIVDRGLSVMAIDYVKSLDAVQRLRLNMAQEFESFDVLLTATSAAMPWPAEQAYPQVIGGRTAGPRGAALFSTFVNAAGLPAISVPIDPGDSKLPIGMQIVGRFGADLLLLRLAKQFELHHPWHDRKPVLLERIHDARTDKN
jgi:aspartyl-tRNA(Asn)/glutamyl-tRNA(Gln) amidotransferase subunit A